MKKTLVFIMTFLFSLAYLPLPAAAAPSIPVLVVKSFSTSPSPVQPGQAFTLTITLINQGKKDASNITLTLDGADESKTEDETQKSGQTFLPVQSGNVAYIDKIKKGATKTVKFKLSSKNDTAPGIYDINLALSYGYSRITFNNNFSIGVTLQQKDSLVLKGLSYPQKIKLGETATISGDIVNISNASLKAVTVDYTGEGLEKQSEFFGVFETNNSDSLENTLKPEKAGISKVGITLSYYDSFGKKQEAKREISIIVEDTAKEQAKPQDSGGSWFMDFIKFIFGLGSGK
jgi:hypothetical protein